MYKAFETCLVIEHPNNPTDVEFVDILVEVKTKCIYYTNLITKVRGMLEYKIAEPHVIGIIYKGQAIEKNNYKSFVESLRVGA